MPSFTTRVPDLQASGPVVEVRIAVGSALEAVLSKKGTKVPVPVPALAMIDTGATGTVLRPDLIRRLGLKPVGVTFIHTPSSTNIRCLQYLTRLVFPSNVVVETVAIEAPLQGQHIECLVGRDVLRHGVFIYNGYMQDFTLSF